MAPALVLLKTTLNAEARYKRYGRQRWFKTLSYTVCIAYVGSVLFQDSLTNIFRASFGTV